MLAPGPTDAAANKELRHLKGTTGYQSTAGAPLSVVVGSQVLPDDAFAVTQASSAALLTLPDSSLVGIGASTRVQVGAFDQTAQGPGSTITLSGGALRFDVRRPAGAVANYTFKTPTSTVSVRGTVGLLSLDATGTTTVACLACAADSVTVTVGTQTFTLLTGQILTISIAGVVVAGALTAAVLAAFAGASVSTSSAVGAAAATAGVAAGSGLPAAAAIGIGAAAAGGAAAGVVNAVNAGAAKTPAPVQNGTITVQGKRRPQ